MDDVHGPQSKSKFNGWLGRHQAGRAAEEPSWLWIPVEIKAVFYGRIPRLKRAIP